MANIPISILGTNLDACLCYRCLGIDFNPPPPQPLSTVMPRRIPFSTQSWNLEQVAAEMRALQPALQKIAEATSAKARHRHSQASRPSGFSCRFPMPPLHVLAENWVSVGRARPLCRSARLK